MFAETETVMFVTAVAVGTYYAEICVPFLNILYYKWITASWYCWLLSLYKTDAEIIATQLYITKMNVEDNTNIKIKLIGIETDRN